MEKDSYHEVVPDPYATPFFAPQDLTAYYEQPYAQTPPYNQYAQAQPYNQPAGFDARQKHGSPFKFYIIGAISAVVTLGIILGIVVLAPSREQTNTVAPSSTIDSVCPPNINARNKYHRTLLMEKITQGGSRSEIQHLIDCGADVNARTDKGATVLILAAKTPRISPEVITVLLDHGAEVQAREVLHNLGGKTALHYAAENGNMEVTQLLLNHKANISAKDNDGITPLHEATFSGNTNTVRLLLDHGAYINAKTNTGYTPLHYAAANTLAFETVRLLLDRKANINAKTNTGHTPLHGAALNGNTDTVRFLLDSRANINAKDDSGATPLHVAAEQGYTDTARILLDRGASTSVKDNIGLTPLYYAAIYGNTDVVRLLLNHGVHISATDNNGFTPLHYAAMWGKTDTTRFLLDRGANINAMSNVGFTPLHVAVITGGIATVRLLLNRGANINVASNTGWTPLDIAMNPRVKCRDRDSIIALLRSRGAVSNR